MSYAFKLYINEAAEYQVTFSYRDEVLWTSDSYKHKAAAFNAIRALKANATLTHVLDETEGVEKPQYKSVPTTITLLKLKEAGASEELLDVVRNLATHD